MCLMGTAKMHLYQILINIYTNILLEEEELHQSFSMKNLAEL